MFALPLGAFADTIYTYNSYLYDHSRNEFMFLSDCKLTIDTHDNWIFGLGYRVNGKYYALLKEDLDVPIEFKKGDVVQIMLNDQVQYYIPENKVYAITDAPHEFRFRCIVSSTDDKNTPPVKVVFILAVVLIVGVYLMGALGAKSY